MLTVSRGDLLGDPGLDLGLARGDLALAGLEDLAHDDVLDLVGRDVGALERGGDGGGAELGRVDGRQAAAELADGRAGGAEDDGLGHVPKASDVAWPRRCAPPPPPSAPAATEADTIAVGVFDGRGNRPRPRGRAAGRAARRRRGAHELQAPRRASTPTAGAGWSSGLGRRDAFDAERARVAAAAVHGRARELGTRVLCWELPHHVPDDALAAALVEGTVLAAYRFDRYRAAAPRTTPSATASGADRLEPTTTSPTPCSAARSAAGAQNFARELQDTPANDLTPTALGRARAADRRASRSRSTAATGWPSRAWARFLAVAAGLRPGARRDRRALRRRRRRAAARARRQGRHPRHRRPTRSSRPAACTR